MPDLVTMLQTLNQSLPFVETMLVAMAYLAGFAIIFSAMFKLKIYGEARTMMSSQSDIRGPLIMIACGAALIYFPTLYKFSLDTIFGYGNALAYQERTSDRWTILIGIVIFMIQLVGITSFIRGWILLSKAGDRSGQSMTPKAVTHIVGGVLAMNIVGVTKIFNATLGLS